MKALNYLIFVCSLVYFLVAIYYYSTGFMGSSFMVLFFVPLAYILYVLHKLNQGEFYPKLGKFRTFIAALYIAICIYSAYYLMTNYMGLLYYRVGSFNYHDIAVALLIFFLLLEYSRREHKVLFALIIILAAYSILGPIFPGMLKHPGVSFERILTSSTIELKLGAFGTYAQVGIGLIGAFLLLMGIAKGFEVDKSVIKTIVLSLGKRPTTIPQTVVLSSMAVATCTGSGAAGSALLGQFAIPAMKKAGFPPLYAAATLGCATLGGLIMPPVMAIAAFIMVEFLGVSYFEVMVRGFLIAFIYYFAIVFAVHLLSVRFVTPKYARGEKIDVENVFKELRKLTKFDKLHSIVFFSSIALLIYLMGWAWWPEIRAALFSALFLLICSSIILIISEKDPRKLLSKIKSAVESYPAVLIDILLLLTVLGIIINLFTVTGWLLKLGFLLTDLGRDSLLLLIAIGFVFVFFLGFGLPPSATYIIAAVLIAPYLVSFGVNPWVAHFFLFLGATISEFTPPVALIAAVISRIAETPFIKTAIYTQKWILPVYLLIFAVFSWPEIVVISGLDTLKAFAVILAGILVVTAGSFGLFFRRRGLDYLVRILIIAIGLAILYMPQKELSLALAILSLALIVLALFRTKRVSAHT